MVRSVSKILDPVIGGKANRVKGAFGVHFVFIYIWTQINCVFTLKYQKFWSIFFPLISGKQKPPKLKWHDDGGHSSGLVD